MYAWAAPASTTSPSLSEITEALVIGAEDPDAGYWTPLLVLLLSGVTLDDALRPT